MPARNVIYALLVAFVVALVTVTQLPLALGDGRGNHAAPFNIHVSGQASSVWAVAGIQGVDTPAAAAVTRVLDNLQVGTDEAKKNQKKARKAAWRAVVKTLRLDPNASAPQLEGPQTWEGESAGLAYGLAWATYNRPQIVDGRTIVATGVIFPDGSLNSVRLLHGKVSAAVEADADIFFYPNSNNPDQVASLRDAEAYLAGTGHRLKLVPVGTLREAVSYLKETSTWSQR